jgi:outer membrane receptor protein involved in Fe transport
VFHNDPAAGWRPFDSGGNSDTGDGDYYNYQPEAYLITPVRRLHLYSRAVYEQSEQIRGYIEAFYTNRTSSQRLAPTALLIAFEGIEVAADNYYNPFGRPFADVRRRMVEAGPRLARQSSHTLQLFLGIEGDVPDDAPFLKGWRWDLSYGHGQNRTISMLEGNLVRSRLRNALGPSHMGPDGSARCGTADVPISGCVPLNLFGGAGTITPEMLSYVGYTGIESGDNQLHQALFTASGRLLGNRGGRRLSLGVGAEYQRHSGSHVPDPFVAMNDAIGLGTTGAGGNYDARETYAELSLIPIVGSPLARHLEVVGAVRFSDFTTDAFATWQVRGVWQSAFGLSLRGGYHRMFRAPSIADLFGPVSFAFPAVTDPCDTRQGQRSGNARLNCSLDGLPDGFVDDRVQLLSQEGGNRELARERATALNLGAAYHPPFIPGLGLELGYFHLEMNNHLQSVGADALLRSCYEANPDERKYCDRIQRSPANGQIVLIDDTLANVDAGPETSGMDIAVRYRLDTLLAGTFGLDWEGVRLLRYDLRHPDGSAVHGPGVYDLGMSPEWKYNVSASWWSDSWEANARLVYIGSLKECEENECRIGWYEPPDAPFSRTVSAWSSVGFSIAYTETSPLGTSKLTLGTSNVFDSQPPVIYNGLLATTDASTYDFMGRYLYARFEQRF